MKKAIRLPLTDKLLLIKAFVTVAAIRLGLTFLPFKTWYRLFYKVIGSPKATKSDSTVQCGDRPFDEVRKTYDRVAWSVKIASRYVPAATCLTQALAVQGLLGRKGLPSHINVGVKKGMNGELEAHAWVEYQGRTLIGDYRLERYTKFFVLEELL
jgi:hypothetical protein